MDKNLGLGKGLSALMGDDVATLNQNVAETSAVLLDKIVMVMLDALVPSPFQPRRVFDENALNPVIDLMLEQKHVEAYGGTMRLGAYDCNIKKGSKAHEVYGSLKISERHRHRYEVNTDYIDQLKKAGLVFSGMSPDGMLSEIVELPHLDWFVACQFHPEFKSRPERPHPLFKGLIDAVVKQKSV